MPVKRRVPKGKRLHFAPEAFAGFEAGDKEALCAALGIKPWECTARVRRQDAGAPGAQRVAEEAVAPGEGKPPKCRTRLRDGDFDDRRPPQEAAV